FFSFHPFPIALPSQNKFSMRFFQTIIKTAVGWLRQQVVPEPPIVTQSTAPQIYPQILSEPENLHQDHLCARLQLWLRVVEVDLRHVRSWDPDHPVNMALTTLWGRHMPLETLQKALIVERFFAGIGENAKWRLYLAMSRVGLQAYADTRSEEGKETPPTPGEKEDDGVHSKPVETATDKVPQTLAQSSFALRLVRCAAGPSSGRIECALRGDYRASDRYPNA
ncbi:hypothetical protein PpBr36_03795, partial [Pyricularia pennisetigena]|uniref:hypothetical protein n=1 Tax=Pyricularia pennisetigena TaxID=1578925 RepID=UPI00114ED99D